MKYLPFVLLLYSSISFGCLLGPENIIPTPELGFEMEIEASSLCNECSVITINGPISYEGKPYAYAFFTVLFNNKVISKSINYIPKDFEHTIFKGVVSQGEGIIYEIKLIYGNHRCMSVEFNYTNQKIGS